MNIFKFKFNSFIKRKQKGERKKKRRKGLNDFDKISLIDSFYFNIISCFTNSFF